MIAKKFFNISDFARISGVSRQTLIYYDRIGLFSPAYVADNKYRMYSHKQVDNIGIITILSDLGVPLKKIKEILTDISVETTERTLNYQMNAIGEKINKLTVLKDMIEIRLNQIEEGRAHSDETSFSIEEIVEDVPIRIGEKIDCKQEDIDDDVVIAFFDYVEKCRLPLIFTFGYAKNSKEIMKNNNVVSHMWFRLKNKDYANSSIPRGKYLVGYARGDYGNTNYIYTDLVKYVEDNALETIGDVYEEYLIDELSEKNPDNFLMRVCVKIGEI